MRKFKLIVIIALVLFVFTGCTLNINLPEKNKSQASSSESSLEESSNSSQSSKESLSPSESNNPKEPGDNDLGKPTYEYNDIPKIMEGQFFSFNQAYEVYFDLTSAKDMCDVELEEDDNHLVWKIKGILENNKYEVKISAVTGEVLKNETHSIGSYTNQKTFTIENIIPPEVAVAIAQSKKLGTLDSLDLDFDDGSLSYEIEIDYQGEDWEFDINAQSGEITKMDN